MATIAMMLGGAVVNALAFSGSQFLFSNHEEQKRHDEAMEKLTAARDKWNRERSKRLDFLNERLRKEGHALYTFKQAGDAMRLYSEMTGEDRMPPEPKLSDFYTPSEEQQDNELKFVLIGTAVAFFFARHLKIL